MLAPTQPETFLDGRVTLLNGDVRAMLARLPDDHFDCVVTSPPYWGLRDYGVAGQIGLEPSLGEHLDAMVDVFREVRRVLKPSGTCWVNYGDCYATSPNGRSAADTKAVGNDDRTFRDKPFSTIGPIRTGAEAGRAGRSQNLGNTGSDGVRRNFAGDGYLKPKDLCMVPNRLAIALQDDGWWVRSEIIWHKSNPMPESTRDRPTTAHEKIWLLTKRERYFYDADAIAEECSPNTHARISQNLAAQEGSHRANGGSKTNGPMRAVVRGSTRKIAEEGKGIKSNGSFEAACSLSVEKRNSRTVWTMATEAFSEAHFATFPTELAERCIKAGCPAGGLVLDPFGGAGTTGLVAASLARHATLIELNPEYCRLARTRIEAAFMGKEEGARHMAKQLGKTAEPGPLFAGLS